MLFNSYIFIFIFLPIVVATWWILKSGDWTRLIFLTCSSYIFYGYWDWRYCILMFLVSVFSFYCGSRIHHHKNRKKWLIISVAGNLFILGYFKYFYLIFSTAIGILNSFDTKFRTVDCVFEVILPIGISFYIFQAMSYTIDIYYGKIRPSKSIIHFLAYVSLFSQLIAGPILRYSRIESQLKSLRRQVDWSQFQLGIQFFVLGMSKKVLIADNISTIIQPYFANIADLNFLTSWIAIIGYSGQLYFDFSGYSDMAVGLGLLLGFRFPQNFNSPYKSANISEFWTRWHITLSQFLRDYLYIPLGGSKKSKVFTLRNLFITMFLGGLWHGSGWNYALWGVYHGLLLILFHLYKNLNLSGIKSPFSKMITLISVMLGWVLFRCNTFTEAVVFYQSLAVVKGVGSISGDILIQTGLVISAIAICIWFPNSHQIDLRHKKYWPVVMSGLLFICIINLSKESPFLYFQF